MLRLLMRRRRPRVPIRLDEHKTGRVVLLLGDIEPRNAGFFDALPRVEEGGLLEGLDALRFYVNMNVNN